MDKLQVIQALAYYRPIEDRAQEIAEVLTGHFPDNIEWPTTLSEDAVFTVTYTETILGHSDNATKEIPLRYLWEGLPSSNHG